jgi:hypothetical protein
VTSCPTSTSIARKLANVACYVGRKYGRDHVAQIITFGTMLGMSYGEVLDRVHLELGRGGYRVGWVSPRP